LGNIEADENGEAEINTEDYFLSLFGSRSIIGRAVVVSYLSFFDYLITDYIFF